MYIFGKINQFLISAAALFSYMEYRPKNGKQENLIPLPNMAKGDWHMQGKWHVMFCADAHPAPHACMWISNLCTGILIPLFNISKCYSFWTERRNYNPFLCWTSCDKFFKTRFHISMFHWTLSKATWVLHKATFSSTRWPVVPTVQRKRANQVFKPCKLKYLDTGHKIVEA